MQAPYPCCEWAEWMKPVEPVWHATPSCPSEPLTHPSPPSTRVVSTSEPSPSTRARPSASAYQHAHRCCAHGHASGRLCTSGYRGELRASLHIKRKWLPRHHPFSSSTPILPATRPPPRSALISHRRRPPIAHTRPHYPTMARATLTSRSVLWQTIASNPDYKTISSCSTASQVSEQEGESTTRARGRVSYIWSGCTDRDVDVDEATEECGDGDW